MTSQRKESVEEKRDGEENPGVKDVWSPHNFSFTESGARVAGGRRRELRSWVVNWGRRLPE